MSNLPKRFYTHPEAKHLPAVKAQQVWACDANSYFSRPGPRVVRGAEILQAILKGEAEKLGRDEAKHVLSSREVKEVVRG